MYLILCVIALYCFYLFLKKPHKYWKNRGIKHDQPTFLFGTFYETMLQRISKPHLLQKLYNEYKDERYFGLYQFLTPILMIRDLELIKSIAIKDFDNFTDHRAFSRDDIDPLWSKNLFSSQGQKWRDLRTALSPSFTSSKMKAMFELTDDCAKEFTNYFLEQKEDLIPVEMKSVFTKYTNDVIATCAFGVTCNSLREPDNELYLKGLAASNFSGLKVFKFLGYSISPALTKFFGIKIISDSMGNFFKGVIKDTIRVREEQGLIRPDMIQLLLEARKKHFAQSGQTITDEEITAQALIFFLAGFDTASALMSFLAYELAVNKDCQDKLRKEIEETYKECNGKLTYEALMKMKYFDMVVSETLRKWPPMPTADRVCTKEYIISPELPHENIVRIEKGTTIWFPIFAIQNDPNYFPEPEKFDPKRFSDENKTKIIPQAYIPFGLGPRNCIGSRFVLMKNKALMFYILRKFEIVPVKESVIPLKLCKKSVLPNAQGGFHFGFKKIK